MPYTSSVLITGGSSGLGFETAAQIARARPDLQVVVAARTGAAAAERLVATGLPNVAGLDLDLSSQPGVRAFALAYRARAFSPIAALVLNAGLQVVEPTRHAADGTELMLATNHVGHALLFFLLRDCLAADARIVTVGSSVHDAAKKRLKISPVYTTADDAAHPPTGAGYETWDAGFARYAMSKLCQIMWSYALAHRADDAGKAWDVNAFDPGVMPTGLYRWQGAAMGYLTHWFFSSWVGRALIPETFPTATSAQSLAALAVGDEHRGVSGKYFGVVGVQQIESSVQSHDVACQDDLWAWTLEHVAADEAERETFGKL